MENCGFYEKEKQTGKLGQMVPLIIIYNHRFDQNIPKLDKLYEDRFSQIYHLVPFYDGDRLNVIPVFENSFYFHGYIPQVKHILKKLEVEHFLFIGDDLILHPSINESNVISELNLKKGEAFLPWKWGMLGEMSVEWANTFPALNSFYQEDLLLHHAPNWKSILPDYQIAKDKFKKLGLKNSKISISNLLTTKRQPRFKINLKEYIKLTFKRRRTPPYPLLCAYSDIFIISKAHLESFSIYCELFRQMRLWVEVALPTAAVLSHDCVKFESDSEWKGTTYWQNENEDEMKIRFEQLGYQFTELQKDFHSNELYIHPVKLSQWKN